MRRPAPRQRATRVAVDRVRAEAIPVEVDQLDVATPARRGGKFVVEPAAPEYQQLGVDGIGTVRRAVASRRRGARGRRALQHVEMCPAVQRPTLAPRADAAVGTTGARLRWQLAVECSPVTPTAAGKRLRKLRRL